MGLKTFCVTLPYLYCFTFLTFFISNSSRKKHEIQDTFEKQIGQLFVSIPLAELETGFQNILKKNILMMQKDEAVPVEVTFEPVNVYSGKRNTKKRKRSANVPNHFVLFLYLF